MLKSHLLVLLACPAVLAGSIQAAVIDVPADQPTIQAGIDAAVNGDEVVVAAGTYVEHIDLLGKLITLRSSNPADPAAVAATIVDGGGLGPIVTCTSGEGPTTVIDGLTFANGGGADVNGGAMFVEDSSPTVRGCLFRDNICTLLSRGGAIYVRDGDPDILDCVFERNEARYAGAIRLDITSNATISGCTFTDNVAQDDGGAISKSRGESTISFCEFDGNSAGLRGGALWCDQTTCLVLGCEFTNNSAGIEGGGIHLIEDQSQVALGTLIGNSAGERGGGTYVTDESDVVIDTCEYRANSAGIQGGGLYAEDGTTFLYGSEFCFNQPDQAAGFWIDGGSNSFLPGCYNYVPDDWLWFDPFEWDDVLGSLGFDLLADVTFEEAILPPDDFAIFDDPLNAFTDNGVFRPCDIPGNVCIKSNVSIGGVAGEAPRGPDGLIAAGEGYMNAPDVTIMSNEPDDSLDIVLPPMPMVPDTCTPDCLVPADMGIAMQVCAFPFAEPLTISVYDDDDVLIGNFDVEWNAEEQCTFVGIVVNGGLLAGEDGEPRTLGRINLWSPTSQMEGVSNLELYGFLPCVADLDGDGTVDTVDLLQFLSEWGANPGSAADFDADGLVGTADLLFMLSSWGACP